MENRPSPALSWDDAWAQMVRRWWPEDPVRPDEQYRDAYAWKFETAKRIQPRVIMEIGVRAGYSALAMLLAAPQARYIGIEQDRGGFGGLQGITAAAVPSVLAGFEHEIRYRDSASLATIEEEVDLFHVDGDHSYDGCWHDLELAWRCSQWVLVDDYDFCLPVRAATDHFIVTHRLVFPMVQALTDGGFRGSMLLQGARHPIVSAWLAHHGGAHAPQA